MEVDLDEVNRIIKDYQSETTTQTETTDGAERKESEAKENTQETVSEPTKRRGRPKGSKNRAGVSEPKPPVIPEPFLRGLIALPYAAIASKYGEYWKLSDDEVTLLIPSHMALCEQYLPDMLKEHAALYTVCSMHLFYLFVRYQTFRTEQPKEENVPS